MVLVGGDAATGEKLVPFISILVSAVELSWVFTSGTSVGVGGGGLSASSTGAGTFFDSSAPLNK